MNRVKLSELHGEFFDHIRGQPCLYFVCPSCKSKGLHAHGIIVGWTAPSFFKSGAIWQKSGDTIQDVTISPSIDLTGSSEIEDSETGKMKTIPSTCSFHGFVRNGWVEW